MLMLFILGFVAVLASASDCPNGFESRTDCHKRCSNLAEEFTCEPQLGCYCEDAKFLTNDGRCVHMFECPTTDVVCPKRQLYSFEHKCPKTCTYPLGVSYCWKIPSNRCECEPGFYRNAKDNCVSSPECKLDDVTCGDGLVPKCGNGNIPTCKDYNENPALFAENDEILQDCLPTCSCPEGQFFDANTQSCINAQQCQDLARQELCVEQDPNSFYSSCMPGACIGAVCTLNCLSGCFCKEGFVKSVNGMCIKSLVK